jgi:hypothetical protein
MISQMTFCSAQPAVGRSHGNRLGQVDPRLSRRLTAAGHGPLNALTLMAIGRLPKVPPAYMDQAVKDALQLNRAGIRLAFMLNQILSAVP